MIANAAKNVLFGEVGDRGAHTDLLNHMHAVARIVGDAREYVVAFKRAIARSSCEVSLRTIGFVAET